MNFREFRNWCNNRAADGCWGMATAIICLAILNEVQQIPWYKWKERRKRWEELKPDVMKMMVDPTNAKIREVYPEEG